MGLKGNGAIMNLARLHRMRLWRLIRCSSRPLAQGVVTFVMLNPSTADQLTDDPTIRRCVGFAKHWGYSQLQVVNLFSYRATNPKELKRDRAAGKRLNTIGADAYIRIAIREAGMLIAAWGALQAWARPRAAEVIAMSDHWFVLGLTKKGYPRHPLYMPKATMPTAWQPE